jgi:pectin methylesterase-like acyl-CoA thioesterase
MSRLLTLLAAASAMAALMAIPAQASPGDRYVATTGSDVANNCTVQATPCQTIQHAVDVASANDTIHVAAGTYPEPAGGPLNVNKTLTLLGAQAGIDARTRAGAESIVTDPQGTSVSASDVVIDGFTVQDSVVRRSPATASGSTRVATAPRS